MLDLSALNTEKRFKTCTMYDVRCTVLRVDRQ